MCLWFCLHHLPYEPTRFQQPKRRLQQPKRRIQQPYLQQPKKNRFNLPYRSIQSFSTKKQNGSLRVGSSVPLNSCGSSKMGASRGWHPGRRNNGPFLQPFFPKGIKLIPIGPWVKASRQCVDIIHGWSPVGFMVVLRFRKSRCFHIYVVFGWEWRCPTVWLSTFFSHPFNYLGVSFNGGTPETPEMIIFSRKTHTCWVPPFTEAPI